MFTNLAMGHHIVHIPAPWMIWFIKMNKWKWTNVGTYTIHYKMMCRPSGPRRSLASQPRSPRWSCRPRATPWPRPSRPLRLSVPRRFPWKTAGWDFLGNVKQKNHWKTTGKWWLNGKTSCFTFFFKWNITMFNVKINYFYGKNITILNGTTHELSTGPYLMVMLNYTRVMASVIIQVFFRMVFDIFSIYNIQL